MNRNPLTTRNLSFHAERRAEQDGDKPLKPVKLRKGAELYKIVFTRNTKMDAVRTLARWASDPELSFTWYDAAKLSQKIRERV